MVTAITRDIAIGIGVAVVVAVAISLLSAGGRRHISAILFATIILLFDS
jgi:hypothetical protein